ncbi:2-phosphosulfolactate phosphatase [Stieleria sp. JC731]|uniref:2-phosphosulfolactate phosphatase n=1 Tax=Pirellulaceae TaxID=2691357 RepID=UPI001E2DA52C|nr:2-phosphosulfolactate phosphatase [Stieleria sp. JC731]MCC9604051.1 2-phosphosulfolactate phosphatase [Stieleria sp. JC731]
MVKKMSVALLPRLIEASTTSIECAIVIDVLRATSVMTTAGKNGAKTIRTCGEIEIARQLADQANTNDRPLLCGERSCVPIDGFDLGNSPAEYPPERVAGHHVLLTTTNGTKAIAAVADAERLLIASFLNLAATVDSVTEHDELLIVCAGTDGKISAEDVLLAGAIVDRLMHHNPSCQLDDSARLALSTWRQASQNEGTVGDALRLSLGGSNLIKVGYEEDIGRCAVIDSAAGVVERDQQQPDERTVVFRWRGETVC